MAGIYLNAFTFVAFVSMILFRFEEKRENKTFFSGRTKKEKKVRYAVLTIARVYIYAT